MILKNLYLNSKDKMFIGILSLLFILLSITGWVLWGHIMFIISLGIIFFLLLTLQIEIYRRLYARSQEISKRHLFMDITDVIQSRRSIHKFIDKPVKENDIVKMLESARRAPSGGNTQPWHFIVIRDREKIDQMEKIISGKIGDLPRILKEYAEVSEEVAVSQIRAWSKSSLFFAQAAMTVAVLMKNITALYYKPYVQYVMDKKGLSEHEAKIYMSPVEVMSVSAAIENLILSAHSMGYGSCWLRVPFMAKEDLMNFLGVQPPWDLIAIVPVGYPDPDCSLSKVKRKKMEDIATFL